MPRLSIGLEQVFTNLGIVGAGYKLYFFATNTTTPKTTYSDEGLTIPNTNPVVLNAAGRPNVGIWGADPAQYRMVLGTPDSTISTVLTNPVVDVDPVDNYNTGSIVIFDPIPTAYWGTTAETSTHYTLDPALVDIASYSNTQTFFIDFHIACGANPDLDINNLGVIVLGKYKGDGTIVNLEAGDVQPQRYIAINNGSRIVILNPEHPANLPANTTTWRGLTYLPSPITIANNVSDANNDIDFSAGVFQLSDGSGQGVASALTKRLDAAWAAGNNQGGLDTGSKANNQWYCMFTIYNPTTKASDFIFSVSGSPNMTLPNAAGYTIIGELIGVLLTDGSGNIRPAKWFGKLMEFTTPVLAYSSNLTTTQVSISVSPGVINCEVTLRAAINVTTANTYNWVQISPAWKGNIGTPSIDNCIIGQGEAADDLSRPMRAATQFSVTMDSTSPNVYAKTDSSVNSFSVSVVNLSIF